MHAETELCAEELPENPSGPLAISKHALEGGPTRLVAAAVAK